VCVCVCVSACVCVCVCGSVTGHAADARWHVCATSWVFCCVVWVGNELGAKRFCLHWEANLSVV
jgi:hypothetical protein